MGGLHLMSFPRASYTPCNMVEFPSRTGFSHQPFLPFSLQLRREGSEAKWRASAVETKRISVDVPGYFV